MAAPKLWSKLGSAGEITSPAIGSAGTVTGSPTYPASKFGNGILSNADGEGCYFPTAANTINISKGTIECWAKINFAPTDAAYHYLWYFLRWESGYGGIEVRFDPSVDKFTIEVNINQTTIVKIDSGAFSWSAGNIVHFAVTWDRTGGDIGGGKTLSFRINNTEYSSSTTTWASTTVRANLWVGVRVGSALHSDMVIDNLKTYDGCITNFTDRNYECCAPPTGCTPHYVATDKSYCTWADNSISEQGFRVEYRIDGGGWTYYQNVGAGVTQSSTKTVGANHKIAWQVRAYIGTGYTGFDISGDVYTTPAAPSGATTHYVATNKAHLHWTDNSAYESGFRLEYAVGAGGWTYWYNAGANVIVSSDGSFGANTRVKIRVRAYIGALVSAYSEGSYVYTTPTAPSGIALSWLSQDETIRIEWTDNSAYEQDFDIEKKSDEGAFSHLVYDAASPYDDAAPSGTDHRYAYQVRARCPDGRLSSWNTSGWIYSTPSAPTNCAISLGTINVTWTDNSAYEDGFKIERELDGGGWNLVHTTGAEAESWADASQPTEANVKHQYRVRAYKGGLYSTYSTSTILNVQMLTENLALKEEETADVSSLLTESLAMLESLPTLARALTITESLALLESLPVLERGLTLEELLALKEEETADVSSLLTESLGLLESLPTLERALTLEETLALKEKLAEFGFTLEESLALLEDLPILERGLTLTEALALLESETADVSSVLTESLALKEDLTQLARALTLEEALALLEEAHAETLLFKVDKDGNITYMGTLDGGAF